MRAKDSSLSCGGADNGGSAATVPIFSYRNALRWRRQSGRYLEQVLSKIARLRKPSEVYVKLRGLNAITTVSVLFKKIEKNTLFFPEVK